MPLFADCRVSVQLVLIYPYNVCSNLDSFLQTKEEIDFDSSLSYHSSVQSINTVHQYKLQLDELIDCSMEWLPSIVLLKISTKKT